MIEDMQLRNLAPETQRGYLHHITGLARFYQTSPEHLTLEDLRQYQVYLAQDCLYSADSLNQFVSAAKFLYDITLEAPFDTGGLLRAKVPHRLPTILSPQEVAGFFEHVHHLRDRTALMVAYGAGLRVSEVVSLKISDIDSPRMLLRVQQGKGQRDRYATLSPRLLQVLRAWWRAARPPYRVAVSQRARRPPSHSRHLAGGLPQGRPLGRHPQTHHRPHPPSQLRHAPAGKRHGYPRHSGHARSSAHRYHRALHGCLEAAHRPHPKSPGSPAGP